MRDYETRRQEHVALCGRLMRSQVERLRWSPEQLRLERRDRLRALLRVALSKSAWHRERLAGVDPDRFEEDDLQHLPPMTKRDLMANWDDIVTDRRLTLECAERHLAGLTSDGYLLDEFHAVASGGSTGTRGVYVWGWEAWATAYAGFLATNVWDRMVTPDVAAMPNSIAMVAAHHATHMTSAIAQTFSSPAMKMVSFPVTEPIERIIYGLNAFQPVTLIAYASALAILANEARSGRLRIAPRRIVSTSEPLLPEVRQCVEQVFQASIANIYGTSEAGPMAIGCWRSAGMHLADDLTIIEPVDRAGRAVGTGVRSAMIYVTALSNPTLPLIRFEMTDQVELLDRECPCGSGRRLIADVEGRVDDMFAYDGGVVVHPHVFRSVLCREREIIEYQVCQTATGADVVAVGAPGDPPRIARAIAAELERLGVSEPRVAVRVVDRLERQPTGKMRRFVPLASPVP